MFLKVPRLNKNKHETKAGNLDKVGSARVVVGLAVVDNLGWVTVMGNNQRSDCKLASATLKADFRRPSNLEALASDSQWDVLVTLELSDAACGELERMHVELQNLMKTSTDAAVMMLMSLGAEVSHCFELFMFLFLSFSSSLL